MRRRFPIRALVCAGMAAFPSLLWAHEAGSREEALRWCWEPFVILPIVASALLYAVGSWRMHSRARRASNLWPVVSFAAGTVGLIVALDSPVHLLGGQLFWVHMTQHELLMLVAA